MINFLVNTHVQSHSLLRRGFGTSVPFIVFVVSQNTPYTSRAASVYACFTCLRLSMGWWLQELKFLPCTWYLCVVNGNCVQCMIVKTSTVVSHKPFATLASVQNAGGAYTRDATISLAITPSLSIKHDSIVICRWGAQGVAEREAERSSQR